VAAGRAVAGQVQVAAAGQVAAEQVAAGRAAVPAAAGAERPDCDRRGAVPARLGAAEFNKDQGLFHIGKLAADPAWRLHVHFISALGEWS